MGQVNVVKLQRDAVKNAAKGNYKKAIKQYLKIYQENPDDTRIWIKIGDVYRKMDQPEQAIEFYQKAAAFFALKGQLLQAIGVNKLILEIDVGHTETQDQLAQLYAQKKKLDQQEHEAQSSAVLTSNILSQLKRKSSAPTVIDIEDEDSDEELAFEDVHDVLAQATSEKFANDGEIGRLLDQRPDIPLFSTLDEPAFVGTIQQASCRQFEADEVIIDEGDQGDAIYIIAEGSVRITKMSPENKQVALARLGEGAFFGELSYFRGSPRTATVSAAENVQLLVLERSTIDNLIKQFPDIKKKLLDHYHRRLLDTIFQISPLFRTLDIEEQSVVRDQFEYVEVLPGDQLITQGSPSPGLFVIAKGLVEPSSTSKDGEKLIYPPMCDGDFFGEISLISGKNATADCVAETDCALYKLSRESFDRLVETNAAFKERAAEVAVQRSQRSKEMLDQVRDEAFTGMGMI